MGANRSFSNAVAQMRAGNRVRRAGWANQDALAYLYITTKKGKEVIEIHTTERGDGLYSPVQEDLLTEDWELCV